MALHIGKHAGFCQGVARAVHIARDAAREEPCVALGPLIHNPQVLEWLAQHGVQTVNALDEVTHGAVVIRAHGVPRSVLQECADRGLRVVDATCPCVKRVHSLVQEAGQDVILIGLADHPEVEGTAGWCQGPVHVISTLEQAQAFPRMERALVVSQTTFSKVLFDQMVEALQSRVTDLTVRDTICMATAHRQAEAAELAKRMDAMIVVGSRESANTRKLYETCLAYCPATHWVETVRDVPQGLDPAREDIGVTAGASTPEWLFKEVVNRMNDMEQKDQVQAEAPVEPVAQEATSVEAEAPAPVEETAVAAPVAEPVDTAAQAANTAEANFMADVEATLVQIRSGQTITGTVVQISEDEVCVNIGYKSDGLIKRSDLVTQDVKVGDEIDVEVVKVNDGEGNVLLSQRNIVNRKNWEALMALYEADQYVDGVGKEAVKGGLIANVMGVRAFIPASHLSQRYVEKIEDFVGKELKLKIIEVDKAKKRIVCSRKAVIQEEATSRKKEAWDRLAEGEVIKGVVRRLTDFGAFVDVGGVDGLVHVTDLSWGRVKHPSEVVSPNQEISVKILSLDPERERIQLGYKQTQPRPWDVAEEKYPVGSIVEGKVVRITTFGAFVELESGLDGLVHISQCALTRIAKVEDAVQVGQIVRVKVLNVDPVAKRISLSIRAAMEDEAFNYSEEIPGEELSFGDNEIAYSSDDPNVFTPMDMEGEESTEV